MTETAERYDRIAAGYDRWWAPVLARSAVALLDRLDGAVADGARTVLDVGVGTGNLSIAALGRWPEVRVTAIDASREMVRAVEALVEERVPTARDRFEGRVAFAAELPFEAGTFDAAMSSFVLQLVPSRPAALRDIRRVLRPGGLFAHVTWIADDRAFAPDRIFDRLLEEYGFENDERSQPPWRHPVRGARRRGAAPCRLPRRGRATGACWSTPSRWTATSRS